VLKSVHFKNFLSFGPDAAPVELGPLNVLIGANGSGKSNLIEGVGLLRAAPVDLPRAVQEGGGAGPWFWRGEGPAELHAVFERPSAQLDLRHSIWLTREGTGYALQAERIENATARRGEKKPYFYFGWEGGRPMFNVAGGARRELRREDLDAQRSVLEQRREPDLYPELAFLTRSYGGIRLYRNWEFGREAPPRKPQPTDLRADGLDEKATNLAVVLNNLRAKARATLREHLEDIYDGARDVSFELHGNQIGLLLEEDGDVVVPATRLSDGTLRWLALLAILLDPAPPGLVCIEEPELGLHPDLVFVLARLLTEVSRRMQIIVTTHSEALIDALTATPEVVLVCEKVEGSTTLTRLVKDKLSVWLDEYKDLGRVWSKNLIGGGRW
jgi:predicted ATPase